MLKHIDRWFTFIQSLGLGVELMEDVVLVTGCHRTRSWTNIVFSENRNGAQVSFSVRVGISGSDINWQFSREQIRGGVVVNIGPSGDVRPCRQHDVGSEPDLESSRGSMYFRAGIPCQSLPGVIPTDAPRGRRTRSSSIISGLTRSSVR